MKKNLLVCALMMSAMVMAQPPMGGQCKNHDCQGKGQCKKECPETRAVKKAVEYRDALRLTEKQFNKMYKVYLADYTAMQADTTFCGKDKKLTKEVCEAKKAERQTMMANRQTKMKKILDEAQYALWMYMETNKGNHHGQQRHQGQSSQHGQSLQHGQQRLQGAPHMFHESLRMPKDSLQ